LKKVGLVFLQGWGEPLLHPCFLEILRKVKQIGTKVGTTTNANHLTADMAEALVREQMDIVGFSLAGTSPEKNDSIRKGTSLDSVLKAIEHVRTAQARYKSPFPAIHIAYMLLGSNLEELEDMPGFFAGLGVDQVVVSSLALVPSQDLVPEATLARSREEWHDLVQRVQKVQTAGSKEKVDMHFQLVFPYSRAGACLENPGRALVVGAGGDVAPCVMCSLPVRQGSGHYFAREWIGLGQQVFGNVFDRPLNRIWHQPEYKRFRKRFKSGRLPEICHRCHNSRMIKIQDQAEAQTYSLVPGL
jgi:MoaA/NifB/PqqE/SkfB family radical SAM enzyme